MLRIASLVVALGLLGAGCESGGGGAPSGTAAASADVYTVRGIVKSVDGDEVSVHHEAIPAFKDRDGAASDMMSMTMSFGIGDGIDRGMLKPDGKIRMTFEVHWDQRPALRATKVEALADDTALTLQ